MEFADEAKLVKPYTEGIGDDLTDDSGLIKAAFSISLRRKGYGNDQRRLLRKPLVERERDFPTKTRCEICPRL